MTPHVFIIFLAFGGFLLATYLRHKKRRHESFVCPLKAKCEAVIHSSYSRFFGIPVELIGATYYAGIAIGYGLTVTGVHTGLELVLLAATTAAFLFSAYLTFIQIFALRQYCSWCLLSAILCTAMFALALATSLPVVTPYLVAYKSGMVLLHAMAAGVGLGAATVGDFFFFRFLKDFRISKKESEVLGHLSQVIWTALALLVLTGLGIFLSDVETYLASTKFITKMLVVAVLTLNGALLNLLVAPRLVQISFGDKHAHQPGELHRLRKMAFLFGPISIVSWYFVFVLGSLRAVPWTLPVMLGIYGGLLLCGSIGGELAERWLDRRARTSPASHP